MDKATFMQVLTAIVEGFEAADFKSEMAKAQAAGDVGKLMQLPLAVQQQAMTGAGVDPTTGGAAFKAAGREYGADPAVAPLLARMKAALG